MYGRLSLPGKATAVIGMRRAGKTTLLHQIRREHLRAGVARERLVFIGFEDEQLAGMGADQLRLLPEEYYRRFPALRQQEVVTWCLDEIQAVPGWERFVRRLLDSEKVEVFLSGSSAALLSREVATAMRGRGWEVVLHPFSFEEVLRHRGRTIPKAPGLISATERSEIESKFVEYLRGGGFPEAQGLDDATRRRLLRDYVDVAMLRDVMERHGIGNLAALRWLVRHLLGNAAAPFSAERFYRDLRSQGLRVGKDTVHDLIAFLADSFLIRVVWMEAASERQRMVNPRKVYPVDPGLIPVFDRTGRSNVGHALETAVFLELERRRCEVTWVKTPEGNEVDFLARTPENALELIQVCADASEPATAERELRALAEAAAHHPSAKRLLLTLTADALPRDTPKGVLARPAWEWMLEADARA
ncbi:MAG TPA: ATP-binding protein [Thermoanaerobaculia bacterium]|nr:ATP-binding protein [Thermoanaerobaculia bacterium]